MGLIQKSDLEYDDYSWTTYGDDDPEITGSPDSTLLNRKEGYEVLYLVNKFSEKHNFKNKASALKAEMMIHEYLPGEIRAQTKVMKWLQDNWDEY